MRQVLLTFYGTLTNLQLVVLRVGKLPEVCYFFRDGGRNAEKTGRNSFFPEEMEVWWKKWKFGVWSK